MLFFYTLSLFIPSRLRLHCKALDPPFIRLSPAFSCRSNGWIKQSFQSRSHVLLIYPKKLRMSRTVFKQILAFASEANILACNAIDISCLLGNAI